MSKTSKSQAESKAISQSGVWTRRGTAAKKKAADKMKTQLKADKAKKTITRKVKKKNVARKK